PRSCPQLRPAKPPPPTAAAPISVSSSPPPLLSSAPSSSHPCLQHVFVWSLCIHHVDALQLDAMAGLGHLEMMNIRTGEVAGHVVAELHHMEARADDEIAAFCVYLLDHDVADDMIGAPRRLL